MAQWIHWKLPFYVRYRRAKVIILFLPFSHWNIIHCGILGKLIFLALADTYEASGDFEGAAALLERALKKHKKSKKVWMRSEMTI